MTTLQIVLTIPFVFFTLLGLVTLFAVAFWSLMNVAFYLYNGDSEWELVQLGLWFLLLCTLGSILSGTIGFMAGIFK